MGQPFTLFLAMELQRAKSQILQLKRWYLIHSRISGNTHQSNSFVIDYLMVLILHILDIGQTNPEHFWTIQSHIRQLADVYRLETSMLTTPLLPSFVIVLTDHSSTGCSFWVSNQRVLYTPPHIPVGLQMDSRSVPGLHMDSTYNTIKAIYFMIIHLESIWSLHRLCLDSTRYQWPPYGVDPFTLPCVIKENPNLRQRSCDLI